MPTATTARRMFELLEPICLVTFFADECNEEMASRPDYTLNLNSTTSPSCMT
jgi:hypothetical protein